VRGYSGQGGAAPARLHSLSQQLLKESLKLSSSLCAIKTVCMSSGVSGESKVRLGVLGSGKGSNLDALAKYCARAECPMKIVLVASDVENAGILTLAKSHGLENVYVPPGQFRTKLDEQAENRFIAELRHAEVDLVVLAGFMRILKGEFLRAYFERVINIHPSLLPSFPGLEAWKQALDYGVKVTGCTVHFVDQGIDSGAIIAQQTVPVLNEDTPATLHARIQQAEWDLYPRAVEMVALGRVKVQGRRSYIANNQ
jgi:phosphoribosylglycinamide formyltransferase-1